MELIESLARDIKNSKHLVAFTGAGISAESGIPTYRGEGGLWGKYDPSLYADISHFNRDPSYYWNFFKEVRYPLLRKAGPNKGHLALAELERMGILKAVITQNIDGLHQEAGSTLVIELHGTTRTIFCLDCGQKYTADKVFNLLASELPPRCLHCRGRLRPDVVFFGEALNPSVLKQAFDESGACDFLLAVGSSLVVYPAANIPLAAKQAEARLAIINKDPTPLDDVADYSIHEEAGKILGQVLESLIRL